MCCFLELVVTVAMTVRYVKVPHKPFIINVL